MKQIRKYLSAIAVLTLGLFSLYMELISPTVKSGDDLLHIKDKLTAYSFKYGHSGRSQTQEFYLYTEKYPGKYQIPADFTPYFYKTKFEQSVFPGDSIIIAIPKEQKDLLNSGKKVTVFEISNHNYTYLMHELTIANENNGFRIYFGTFLISLAVALFFLINKGIIKPK